MFCCNRNFIFLVLYITIGSNEAKSLKKIKENLNFQESKNIVKRGLSSSSGNDYGPPVHVSSDILQLGHASGVGELAKTFEDPWQGSNLSPGYELWQDTDSGLQNYQPIHAVLTTNTDHIGDSGAEHLGVFSTDQFGTGGGHLSGHITHVPTSTLDGHLSGVLHTHAISSFPEHAVSGNVDFTNTADTKSHFPVNSYGR